MIRNVGDYAERHNRLVVRKFIYAPRENPRIARLFPFPKYDEKRARCSCDRFAKARSEHVRANKSNAGEIPLRPSSRVNHRDASSTLKPPISPSRKYISRVKIAAGLG